MATAAQPGGVGRFSLDYYRRILETALDSGYTFRAFRDYETDWSIYLRHDLDISLQRATTIAAVEKEVGICSTYLPLLRASTYDVLAAGSLRAMEAILRCGHHLGLHYDLIFRGDTAETLRGHLAEEVDILHHLVGVRPEVVSFHRPTKIPFEYCLNLEGIIVTYAPRYFKEIFYYSDSRYQWPDECPEGIFASRRHSKIQLLIHPFWWNSVPGRVEDLIAAEQDRAAESVMEHLRSDILPAYFSKTEDT